MIKTNVKILRRYKAGYIIKEENWQVNEKDEKTKMKVAYTPEGHYIGIPKDAYYLCKKKGIKPELRTSTSNTCSIGFCEKEQRWYGWSHRGIFGFGVYSQVKKGDCAYSPTDKKDFLESCVRFWDDPSHKNTHGYPFIDEEGVLGVKIEWTYNDDIPNEKLRRNIGGNFMPYPEKFGKGEWIAKTLEDAKQMAMDFAEGVS